MTAAAMIPYWKMNGLGNEIVVMDFRGRSRVLTAEDAAAIAARSETRFDQLMALYAPRTAGTEARVVIFNTDGSEAEACGNGTRCMAWLAAEATGKRHLKYETKPGILDVVVESQERITVNMGKPRFGWADIPLAEPFHDTRRIELQIGPIDKPIMHSPSVVNVGNPHAVFWVDDVMAVDLARSGPLLEHHPIFPEGCNISLAHVTSRSTMTVRTWERGAGLTKACGSAACAAAVCAGRRKLTDRRVTVSLPGGPLEIEWRADDSIFMTGPATLEHNGTIDLSTLSTGGHHPARVRG